MNRPDIWIGHTLLKTNDLTGSHDFLETIGLRPVFKNDAVTIFELRGGTHIIMEKDDGKIEGLAPFDFMVEDLDATYKHFKQLNLEVSEISRGEIHDAFVVTEPGGNQITVNSTHVEDHSLV